MDSFLYNLKNGSHKNLYAWVTLCIYYEQFGEEDSFSEYGFFQVTKALCLSHVPTKKKVFITLVNSNEEENVISPNNGALENLQVILQMGKHSKTVKSHPLHRSL